jgi:hypothetical protein
MIRPATATTTFTTHTAAAAAAAAGVGNLGLMQVMLGSWLPAGCTAVPLLLPVG